MVSLCKDKLKTLYPVGSMILVQSTLHITAPRLHNAFPVDQTF